MSLTVATLAVLAAIGAVVFFWLRRAPPKPGAAVSSAAPTPDSVADAPDLPYATEATETIKSECFRRAFSVPRIDYQIMGEHATVLAQVEAAIEAAVHQPEFFPRRPKLLPKLMRAINDSDSTRQELVRLIVEDPALAGNVLQRANSPYYRLTPAPVDSLDRAVVHLGLDGLRSLLGGALLQPVFRLPQGFFDNFATLTWEQAQRSAVAAETYAKTTRSCDPFVAQLLGLLSSLANIVLFRLTLQKYRDNPNVLPRAEVFIRAMQLYGARVASLIAATWEVSDLSLKALNEQQQERSPTAMSPLGKALYYGNLCGALAVLARREGYSVEGAQALLLEQGLARETAHALWHAANKVDAEL